MNAVVKGAKGGSKNQRQPKVANDTAASKTFARLLYGMSEGEVEGLANGLKSVFLDDTPVENDNGAKNFNDLTLGFRAGTNDQTHIEGFESIASEVAVGVELKNTAPWVKGITNLNLDAVVVRVRFGALKQQDPSNGDVSGVTIAYAIEVQTDGGAWELMLDTKVSDKTSANYERTHRIGLPKANKSWLIRVVRKTPNSTSEYVSDKMYVQAITEVVDMKMAYPNTALLGVQYDAETFSNIAKVAVDLKGIKIKVPSNYDPVSRTYVGIWNGLFKRAYTNNPAWIYYDLCTAKRYALGNRLTESMIDKWSLYRLAQYCDQKVSDGKGGEEPRFTCNVYIQSAEAAFDILRKLAGLFRAINYWDGTAIVCDADLPQDTYFTYTRANVIDGQFEYSGTRARDRHTAVKVAWDNPQNRYKTEYVFVRDEQAIAKHGIKMLELEAWGCTSEGQAQRTGQWALKSEQLETRTVSFKVGLDGHIPLPGKVIEIADELFAGRANGGRISAVSKDRKSITLDRDDVVCRVGDRLVVNGEDGKAQARIVASITGRVVTVVSAFDSVAAQNVWVVDAKDLATMKFRVISIAQSEQHQFTITALEHNPAKFDAIDNGAFIDDRPISIINPSVQSPVESVIISSEQMVQQGMTIETMIVSWPQAKDATKYQVEWRKDNGTWLKLPITGNNSAEVAGIYAGKYEARVIAISAFDISSLPTYSVLTELKGKQGKPPKLAFIRATGVLFGMKIDWGFPASGALDTAYVEINVSPDGKSNIAQLGLFAYPTTTHTIQGLQPNLTQFYQGRIVDRIGNKGDWSNWVSGTSSANAKDVLDLLHEQISESQLNKDLQQKIEHIDQIDTDLSGLNESIKNAQNTADKANQDLATERQARIDAINATQKNIDQEVKDRKQDVSDVKAIADKANTDLALERQARIDAINTTQKNIDQEVKDRKQAITDYENGLTQIINQTNQDTLQVIDTLKQSTDQGFAAVQSDMKVITNEQKALSEKTDGVYAQLNPQLAGSTTDMAGSGESFVGSWSLQSAMIEGDLAIGKRVDTVHAEVKDNSASIQQEVIARVDGDKALGQRIDTLNVDFDNSNAAIRNELKVVADKNESTASSLNTYIASNDGKVASITSDLKTTTDKANANTKSIQGLSSEVKVAKGDAGKALKNSATAISTAETAASDAKSASSIASQASATAQSADSKADAANVKAGKAETDAGNALSNSATALSKAEAAATESSANAKSIVSLTASLDSKADAGALTKVESDVKNLDGNLKATTSKVDGIYAQVNPSMAGATDEFAGDSGKYAGVWSEQSARIESDLVLSNRIDSTVAQSEQNKASIQEERTARIEGDRVTTEALNSYISSNDNALASVRQTANTAVDKSNANAQLINGLDSRVQVTEGNSGKALENSASAMTKAETAVTQAGSAASMASQAQATAQSASSKADTANATANKANKNSATALGKANAAATDASAAVQKVDAVEAKLGDYATTGQLTQVDSNVNTVDQKLKAETKRIDGVYAQINPDMAGATDEFAGDSGKYAGVWSEQSARIEGDMAQAKRTDQVSAEMNNNAAIVSTQISTLVAADKALSESISAVKSDFESNKSTVQSQIKTLSDDQSAQSKRIDTVQASATSANTKADNAQSTADDALSKANTANTNLATVKTEVDAVAKESSATAKQVNTLQTTVDGNTASIQEQKKSIDGLYSQWTMKLDVNGYVSGIGMANDGKTSDLIIRADKFAIAPPSKNGNDAKYAFVYQSKSQTLPNGTILPAGLYLDNAVIGQIDAEKINAVNLNAITAEFGEFVTYKDPKNKTGARRVQKGLVVEVYDDNNVMRYRDGLW